MRCTGSGVWKGHECVIVSAARRLSPQEVRAFDVRAAVTRRLAHPHVLALFHHDVKLLSRPAPGVRCAYNLYLVKVCGYCHLWPNNSSVFIRTRD